MKTAELKKLLKAGEWNDVEFKEARADVPKSAFETVSAFANTHGGRLVFGIAQQGDGYEITGVDKPDKVQNDFLSVLHADAKINHDAQVTEHRLDVDGKTILVFQIAENQRTRKPVYLDGDIRRTFLRKGGGDSRLLEPGEKEVRNPSIAMAMRRITMCEQAGTGMRMMREEWQRLGHPAPTYKNDRAWKAFEFFIPGLDKEVDMASDLMKAMFGGTRQVADPVEAQQAQVEAQEAQVGAHETLPQWQKAVLEFCLSGEKTSRELMATAGYESRTGNFKKGLQRMLEQKLIELTLPDKPNSRLQKYRLTHHGRQALSAGHEGAK